MSGGTRYGGPISRFFAQFIDGVILLPMTQLVWVMAGVNLLGALILMVLFALYYVYFLTSDWQATPGKRLLHLHVTHIDGGRLTRSEALQRFLAYNLPFLPLNASFGSEAERSALVLALCIIWFVPILLTDEHTGVHDMLCKTRVREGKPAGRT